MPKSGDTFWLIAENSHYEHLYIVLTDVLDDGSVLVANITDHHGAIETDAPPSDGIGE